MSCGLSADCVLGAVDAQVMGLWAQIEAAVYAGDSKG